MARVQVEHVLTFRNPDVPECGWVEGRDIWWQDVVPQQSAECPVQWVDAEQPLFLLYTSGAPLACVQQALAGSGGQYSERERKC